MVEYLDFLAIIWVILGIVLLFFTFFRKGETWNVILRLCACSGLLLIDVLRIPILAQISKSYVFSVVIIFFWFILALMLMFNLGKKVP